eukprot:c7781_g1_i1.p1 GENE.c7781_g1_i1~~c7781_g1_i1.p1  ORF type:complete len:878 (-),score=159.97 c7781_g1_i1:32-2485(-)
MGAFMAAMDQRMRSLEQTMEYVQKAIEVHNNLSFELRNVLQFIIQNQSEPRLFLPTNISPSPVTPSIPTPTPQQTLIVPSVASVQAPIVPVVQDFEPHQQPTLSLHFQNVETKWFTERVFPTFRVRLIEDATGQVYRKTQDWQVTIHLVDGNGNRMDERMGEASLRTVPLHEGEAEVTGLKFSVVSSKNGNFFVLEAELLAPEYMRSVVKQATSENIVILSCRLFHNPKRPLDALAPDDQLSKMPGIGRLYAERFAAAGIQTIRQLASIDLSIAGRQRRLQLLSHLRRDKGTMTEAKLTEYVDKALDIVRKAESYQMDEPSPPPQQKRARYDSNVSPAPSSAADLGHDVTYQVNVDDFIDYSGLDPTHETSAPLMDVSLGNVSSQVPVHTFDARPSRAVHDPVMSINPAPSVETAPVKFVPARSPSVRPAIQYPLHNAIGTSDFGLVKNVVLAMREGGLPLDEENYNGWTPLMLACAMGNAELVSYLCSLPEVDPSFKSSVNGMTALHVAACEGQSKVIQLLLRQPNVDAGVLNKSLYTPLMMAVTKARVDAVRLLCKIADSFRPKTAPGIGLYHLAALSKNVEVMQLVHEGLRTYSYCTPSPKYGNLVWNEADDRPPVPSILHCAAYAGSSEIVEWLLSQRVQANVVNGDGWTPLHFAAYRHHPECVSSLARYIDVNALTAQGWTALSLAAMTRSDRAAEVVKVLLSLGARDNTAIPANIVSVSTGNMGALEVLHAQGTCLKQRQEVDGLGTVSAMDVGSFFNNSEDVEGVRARLEARRALQQSECAHFPSTSNDQTIQQVQLQPQPEPQPQPAAQ